MRKRRLPNVRILSPRSKKPETESDMDALMYALRALVIVRPETVPVRHFRFSPRIGPEISGQSIVIVVPTRVPVHFANLSRTGTFSGKHCAGPRGPIQVPNWVSEAVPALAQFPFSIQSQRSTNRVAKLYRGRHFSR